MKQGKSKLIPHVHPVKPVTDEEKVKQAARLLAQKREQYFSIILSGLLSGALPTVTIEPIVDRAIAGADYALRRLYNLPKTEDEK